ncbi:MAG: UPF0104 family protein, partial [Solimonas sp.]
MNANRPSKQQAQRPPAWRWLGHGVTLVFIMLVGWLIVTRAQAIDWDKVWQSLREMRGTVLLLSALAAAASYALYASFDWFARIYTTRVPRARQFAIALVSYAFNLNLGALIGSVGFRYRLYSRSGVETRTIARIVGLSLVTNWSGYVLLGGVVFAARCVNLPKGWELGSTGLQGVGIAMIALLVAYVAACARLHGKMWT